MYDDFSLSCKADFEKIEFINTIHFHKWIAHTQEVTTRVTQARESSDSTLVICSVCKGEI